jgi:ribosomal protein S18 acetylase RimI-like enzyme
VTEPALAEMLRLADQNMWQGYRQLAALAPGGEMLEQDGVLCVANRSPSPVIVNTAFRTDPSIPADVALEWIDAYYLARQHGYCVYAADHGDADLAAAAIARGLEHVVDLPEMVLDAAPAPIATPQGVTVEPVTDRAGSRAYAAIMADSFTEPAGQLFSEPASLVGPNIGGWIAYVDGEPAAGASIMLSHGIGLIATVGTLEVHRRRGLGALVTRVAARAAFDRGARFVSLQSSPAGLGVYEGIGFRVVSVYRLYGRSAVAA